ncbi:MAG: phytanoyl-CoA dioxygenase family protein [Verrucomicrobiota bacterium]
MQIHPVPAADTRKALDADGWLLWREAVPFEEIEILKERIDSALPFSSGLRSGFAKRDVLHAVAKVARLLEANAVRNCLNEILGCPVFVVRSLFFDKTGQANWKVAWHQDITIAVRKRIEAPGFGPWSMKAGVPHVQAPAEVLERMLTLRVHLDPCDASNGALQILPGSHKQGKLTGAAIAEWRTKHRPVLCEMPVGGILVMKPLLLHASAPARRPLRRRVIHFEFATEPLPHGLEWMWQDQIQ